MRKPVDVTYGLHDRPPLGVLLSAALQQAAVIVVLAYPVIIVAREVDATPAQSAALLSLGLITAAASTVLQSLGRWTIGCGYLAPGVTSTTFLAPAILAAQSGGLRLVAGMTLVAGIATVLLARVLRHMRGLLPPEIAGVVAFVIGIGVSLTGVRMLFETPDGESFAVAAITLAVAGALSIWGRGILRWTAVLIALLAGTAAAWLYGMLRVPEGFDLAAVPLVGLPDLGHVGYAFDLALLPVFLVAALASSIKAVGLVTTLQRLNDEDWVRPEPRSIAGGVTGEGLTMVVSGLACAGPAATIGTTNVTMQAATGVTSRVIGFATAAICLVLACFPRAAALLSLVPGPVLAGILLQAGGLMLVNGMQLASSRMLDPRKSLAIGLALVAALGAEAVPAMAAAVPPGLRPLITATALGTVVAILLNALLRVGIRREVSLTLPVDAVRWDRVADFVTRAGASWGARRDVVQQTTDLIAWCLDAIAGAGLARGFMTVKLGFDELRIDVLITYAGPPVALAATPPTPDELVSDADAPARLAGHMIARRASRSSVRQRDGLTELRLVVDH